ncbi:MAG: peptidylprolyl isomerase [Cyanobacteria bacterium J06621_8]
MSEPLIISSIEDLTVAINSVDTTINLTEIFDDPLTTGQIASFEFADTSLGNGVVNVLLFDQAGAGAPASVANFLNYVEDGDYVGSIIHRSIPGFIIQGGGFAVDPATDFSADLGRIVEVPTDPAVVNEFSLERSNTRGTLAYAKLGNDPNSATSQWFFNLVDNSENLDNQNGGFTVFGEVLGNEDLATVDAIAAVQTFNATGFFPDPVPDFSGAFSDVPVVVEDEENADFIGLTGVSLSQLNELEFSVTGNSNPDLVSATINNGELVLDYTPNQSGAATITVEATDLLGDTVADEFLITVEDTEPEVIFPALTVFRFLNTDTGAHFYTGSEVERQFVADNLPNYNFEGGAFVSVDPFTGSPEPQEIFRLLNQDTGTHLYTISEFEQESVVNNLPNFSLETSSFFGYAEAEEGTIPVYRFFNTQTGAHFYTPSETEREFIIDNLPNYQVEGIAYHMFPV